MPAERGLDQMPLTAVTFDMIHLAIIKAVLTTFGAVQYFYRIVKVGDSLSIVRYVQVQNVVW